MIAILVATGCNDAFGGLQEHLPVPLLPLGDRPFLQHIVEYLANQKIRRFELILSHLPEKIEAALGDGGRWGCSFHYHLLPEGADPLRLVKTLVAGRVEQGRVEQGRDEQGREKQGSDERIVLGSAESLPQFALDEIATSVRICHEGVWTGWSVLNAADVPASGPILLPDIETPQCLKITTGKEFLRSQRLVLDRGFAGLLISGREADPGIWISRNVVLHPTAKLNAPVYIGENCRIGRGAQIGPSAVIGSNCIVDEHTIVVDSMISAGTYVGEGLELDSVIVDRNRLLNVRLETSLLASEAFLLGSLTGKASGHGLARVTSVAIALLLLLFLWPVLLLTAAALMVAGKKGAFGADEMLQIPADDDPAGWQPARIRRFRVPGSHGRVRQFFYHFLPGLLSVVTGQLFLVGVQPRSRNDILALPSDWRSLYLKAKAGLITEASVMFGDTPSEDELYMAEAFYVATESGLRDCRLFLLWLWKLVTGWGRHAAETAENPNPESPNL